MLDDSRLSGKIIGSSQNSLYLSRQNVKVKGLCNEIITTHIHSHYYVHVV